MCGRPGAVRIFVVVCSKRTVYCRPVRIPIEVVTSVKVARRSRDGGIVRSSKVFLNCHDLTIPQSKIEDFCQLPLHKGAVGCSRTGAFIGVSQKNRKIVPHSLVRNGNVISFLP